MSLAPPPNYLSGSSHLKIPSSSPPALKTTHPRMSSNAAPRGSCVKSSQPRTPRTPQSTRRTRPVVTTRTPQSVKRTPKLPPPQPSPELRLFYNAESDPTTTKSSVLLSIFPTETKDAPAIIKNVVSKTGVGVFGPLAKNFQSAKPALNISLEGTLKSRSEHGKKCHLPVSALFLWTCIAKAVNVQLELARWLGINDPLALRLEIPSSTSTNGQIRYAGGNRSLHQVINVNKQWVRARSVEYIRLVDADKGRVIPFTPERRMLVGDLRQLAAYLQEDEHALWEYRFVFEGNVMKPRSLLSAYKIPNKATIEVVLIGVECSTCSTRYPGHEKNVSITKRCGHERETCASCLRTWIDSQLETVGWDKISCSECDQILEYQDV